VSRYEDDIRQLRAELTETRIHAGKLEATVKQFTEAVQENFRRHDAWIFWIVTTTVASLLGLVVWMAQMYAGKGP
jgi:hypothetical protein